MQKSNSINLFIVITLFTFILVIVTGLKLHAQPATALSAEGIKQDLAPLLQSGALQEKTLKDITGLEIMTNPPDHAENYDLLCGDSTLITRELPGLIDFGFIQISNQLISCSLTNEEAQNKCYYELHMRAGRRHGSTACDNLGRTCFAELAGVQATCDTSWCGEGYPDLCESFSTPRQGHCEVTALNVRNFTFRRGIDMSLLPPWNCTMSCSARTTVDIRYYCQKSIGCSACYPY